MKSYQVRFWKIQTRRGRRRPYIVRWIVDDRPPFNQSFATYGLADSFRSKLLTAAREGEAFDTDSGLPESMHREKKAITWLAHAVDYVATKWPKASANSRRSIIEAMLTVTPALVRDRRGAPDIRTIRSALRWALLPNRDENQAPEELQSALGWLRKSSVAITDLTARSMLDKALTACTTKLDGSQTAPEYYRRQRRVLYNSLRFAVSRERLRENPLDAPTLKQDWAQPQADIAVDPRVVGNPHQIQQALVACSYAGRRQGPRFVAFFACMYFAMMRPAEVIRLCESNCTLPETGWGKLLLEASRPEVGKDYTDNGDLHDDRGLNGRSRKTVRLIPIPPELVELLRQHIARYGVAPDGRLFRSESGKPIPKSTYSRLWTKVRWLALTPEQVHSPLMGRPYDLRHAGVTWRLSAGVPAAQVAEWAGHSVEVLQRIYHRCMDGYDDVWIDRMNQARRDLP
ncbi:tyrosine-type recombinase/integrase [Nonomuraea sp. NPDC003754]